MHARVDDTAVTATKTHFVQTRGPQKHAIVAEVKIMFGNNLSSVVVFLSTHNEDCITVFDRMKKLQMSGEYCLIPLKNFTTPPTYHKDV